MLYLILSFIVLQIIWCFLGFKEGWGFSGKHHKAFSWNLHKLFNSERIFIIALYALGMLSGAFLYNATGSLLTIFYLSPVMAFFGALTFSFWHNGFYNVARHLIDRPEYTFMTDTEKGVVHLHLPWRNRLPMCVLAVVAFYPVMYAFIYG